MSAYRGIGRSGAARRDRNAVALYGAGAEKSSPLATKILECNRLLRRFARGPCGEFGGGRLKISGNTRATGYSLAGASVVRAYLQTPYNRRKPARSGVLKAYEDEMIQEMV